MTTEQGWIALQQGRIDEAVSLLKQASDQSPQDALPLLGLAQALIATKNLDQAEGMIRLANQRGAPPESMLVHAQVLGERGQRDAASNLLRQYLDKNLPNRPLALALLAEQRIRQGYWDEGTTLMLEGLKSDPHQLAELHLEKIITDMIAAVAGRKIRPVEALKFINKIEYSLPQNNPQRGARFGIYRRAINNGTAVESFTGVAPVYPSGLSAQAAPAPMMSAPPQQQRVVQSTTPLQKTPSRQAPIQQRSAPTPKTDKPSYTPQRQNQSSSQIKQDRLFAHMELSGRGDFARSVREERRLNDELQQHITNLGYMEWPSANTNQIDNIPALNFKHLTVSEQIAERHKKDKFRVTQGSILAQIYMDRCIQTLLQTLPIEIAGTLQMYPDEITQLEINAFDGFLTDLPPIVTQDLSEIPIQDPAIVALGTFLGETIRRSYAASWEYAENSMDAKLKLGQATIDPMSLAEAWLKSTSREDVDLRSIVTRARHALPATHFVPKTYEHIDITKDLKGPALIALLAEQWSFYRFALVRTPGIELVESITELWQNDDAIIFSLNAKWCPTLPEGAQVRGKTKHGTYVMAHIRATGEFLFLSYRPHLIRLLAVLIPKVKQDSARHIMTILNDYYAPGAKIVKTDDEARQLAQSTGLNALHGPQVQLSGDDMSVTFWEITRGKAHRLTITHLSKQPVPWTFENAR